MQHAPAYQKCALRHTFLRQKSLGAYSDFCYMWHFVNSDFKWSPRPGTSHRLLQVRQALGLFFFLRFALFFGSWSKSLTVTISGVSVVITLNYKNQEYCMATLNGPLKPPMAIFVTKHCPSLQILSLCAEAVGRFLGVIQYGLSVTFRMGRFHLYYNRWLKGALVLSKESTKSHIDLKIQNQTAYTIKTPCAKTCGNLEVYGRVIMSLLVFNSPSVILLYNAPLPWEDDKLDVIIVDAVH